MLIRSLPLLIAAVSLAACGMFGGGAPGKKEVQTAVDRMAKDTPILFGSDKPIVKDAKCTKAGTDTYSCVVSLATSSDPKPRTVNVQLTKLSGEWQAQMTGLGS
jgi:hypothetical protein